MGDRIYKNQYGEINHPNISREELEELYCKQGIPARDIAKLYNTSYDYIRKLRKEYALERTEEQKKIAVQKKKERTVSTNLEKYGCENVNQSEQIKQKSRATNLLKYGVENPFQAEEFKEKSRQTMLDRYGVERALDSEEVQQRLRQKNLEKYGVENYVQSQEFKDKSCATSRKRYGVDFAGGLPEFQEKRKRTCRERYGVEHYTQSEEYQSRKPEIQEKIENTCLERYGVTTAFLTPQCDSARRKALSKRYNSPHQPRKLQWKPRVAPFTPEEFRELAAQGMNTVQEFSEATGTSITVIERRVHQFECEDLIDNFSSGPEKEIGCLLNEWGIEHYKTRQIIPPYELDIYCPDFNIAIEFNGSYWHREERLGKEYHKNKSLKCLDKQVFLYQIFEYEWNDERKHSIILGQLRNLFKKNNNKFYARKLRIGFPSKEEKKQFLQDNHLQGNDKSNVEIGLYNQEELICLMTFCKPRFNKKYAWELSRYCSKSGVNVVGGASKIFNYFVKNILKKGETIISYSNEAKTVGSLYQILGFEFISRSEPSYVWTNRKGETFSRYQCQMKNEIQEMTERGYYRVFDCGNKLWRYLK